MGMPPSVINKIAQVGLSGYHGRRREMKFYMLKSGPFYLSRYPVNGKASPMGGEAFDTPKEAEEALVEMRKEAKPVEAPILEHAVIVTLTFTEERYRSVLTGCSSDSETAVHP